LIQTIFQEILPQTVLNLLAATERLQTLMQ